MRLIDADALEQKTRKTMYGYKAEMEIFLTLVDMQPTIEAKEVVHGEWLEIDDDNGVWACSQCNEPYILMYGTPEDNRYNFCPNCGAKMIK